MKKVVIALVAGVVLLVVASAQSSEQPANLDASRSASIASSTKAAEKSRQLCNGTTVTRNCTVDGVNYSTYVYHPAVPEKTHIETVTTYQEEVSSYCTLCVDGTYSPSCATGRGACSHHGGVAQWNAPRYRTVPVYSTKTVVDAPAQEAYYEKATE